ncbi:MAG: hypothetical protein DRQ45_00585 [Gammaproteobacteria bacterium]|nr:MAG: hypothetical protein DRQ45_00585 [Gammaproteobacteria bacterium]
MYYDRVRYTIQHRESIFEVQEPINWKDDEKQFVRNLNYHGITTELSGELTFVGNSRDFLVSILEEYGVNEDVRLLREIKNAQTDLWEKDYEGWVDFLTYKIDDNKFSVKFNSDPLVTLFKSKLNSKVELERIDNLLGNAIDPLEKINLYVTGRKILLTNKLAQPEGDTANVVMVCEGSEMVIPIDLRKLGTTDTGNKDVSNQFNNLPITGRTDIDFGHSDENFFAINETGIEQNVTVILKVDMSMDWNPIYSGSSSITFGIRLVIYENDIDFNLKETIPIYEVTESDYTLMPRELYVTSDEIPVTIGLLESASVQFYMSKSGGGAGWAVGHTAYGGGVQGKYRKPDGGSGDAYYNVSLSVQEDTERPPSNNPAILVYEYMERLNDIVLGAEFRSSLLGRSTMDKYSEDGLFSETAFAHGMWFRGMDGVDKYKPISTSLSDSLEALNVVYPIGVLAKDSVFQIEARDYFYQKYVSISIGDVQGFLIIPSADDYVSTITVGYEKAGGYEEEQGLDEYNRETEYNTILNKTDKELKLISKYRADGYGMEEVRRDNPVVEADAPIDKDSKFDDEIWILDVNLPDEATSWIISDWSKRFEVAPKNVYSPDTAINLWYSPINILLRHGEWIKPPLLKYLDSKIAFNSSEGNSELITQLIGSPEYQQNDGIIVGDLERSAHKGQIATFTSPITWEQLNGNTFDKPNVYGLVEGYFKGQRFRGHILSVSLANGIGDFKIKLYS